MDREGPGPDRGCQGIVGNPRSALNERAVAARRSTEREVVSNSAVNSIETV